MEACCHGRMPRAECKGPPAHPIIGPQLLSPVELALCATYTYGSQPSWNYSAHLPHYGHQLGQGLGRRVALCYG